jgi:hypothetical protein
MSKIAKIDGMRVLIFDTMYDFVKDIDFSYYKTFANIDNGAFVGCVYPARDMEFIVCRSDIITIDDNEYTNVSFKHTGGEFDAGLDTYLLSSELVKPIYVIYKAYKHGYRASNKNYASEAEARREIITNNYDDNCTEFDKQLIEIVKNENPEMYKMLKEYYKEKIHIKLNKI